MKIYILPLSLLLITIHIGLVQAQPVSGNQLEIGQSGSDQVTGNYSGAIGSANTVSKGSSLAVGAGNVVAGAYGTGSVAIGSSNHLGYGFPGGGHNSLAVGNSNDIQGEESLCVGSWNYLVGSDYEWIGASSSFLVGTFNYSAGISTFAAGENNCITGDSENGHTRNTATIGQGLISNWSTSLIVGRYNSNDIPQLSGLLFAIGNGADANNRSNVLEVYSDGKIKIPRQGDILMGEFGNPGD